MCLIIDNITINIKTNKNKNNNYISYIYFNIENY